MSKRNTDSFKQEIFELVGNEYEIIGEYINNKSPIDAIHHSHNGDHIFKMYPKNFLMNGNRCPVCTKNSKKDISYIQEVLDSRNANITVLDKFYKARGSGKKYAYLTLKHNTCEKKFTAAMSNILNVKTGCPYCCKNRRISPDIFNNDYVENITNGEYTLLTEAVYGSDTKIKIRHNTCNSVFITNVHMFNNGRRCPICKSSKNEKTILNILTEHGIDFTYQWTPEALRNGKNTKKFDFYIPSLNLVIEYDGEFHYLPVFGYEYLKETQRRDSEKNDYCKINNVNILRIPFWESHRIDEILNKILITKSSESINEVLNSLTLLNFETYKSNNKLREYKYRKEDIL